MIWKTNLGMFALKFLSYKQLETFPFAPKLSKIFALGNWGEMGIKTRMSKL